MSTTMSNLELLGFSGERKRADGLLHADVSIKVSHQSTNQNLMRDLGQRFLASGHALKFGDHSYSVENFSTDSNDTIRLYLTRESDAVKRAREADMWASVQKAFSGKGA